MSSNHPIVVAIDGHSSCGKSTMAKQLSRTIGYIYVDSGAMYRAVTLYALENGLFSSDIIDTQRLAAAMPHIDIAFRRNEVSGQPETYLNGRNVEQEIRKMEVSGHVSPIAALPFVREALTRMQQAMGKNGGIVMDGRDIGTAVFPHAELKIFVTASAAVRAQRRFDELTAKGEKVDYQEILHNVEERDYIDSHRAVAPLRKAEDALVLDNSALTREQQAEWLLEQFRKRTSRV